MKENIIRIGIIFVLVLVLSSCKRWENFITYFNTYYNADRIMKESEMEFSYFDEKVRIEPRVIVPESDIFIQARQESGPPPFMEEFIIRKHKRQPVEVKLDSIIIKGSKILAHRHTSDYVEGTLYLMAKSYFYQEEWLPSQIKCIELIDRYPAGEKSPDAHLLLSKNLLIQRKFDAGKTMLSRTVDIAWQLKRFDILAEAFRLEADLALYLGDKEGALKPYKQAIVQSNDSRMKAQWQTELASLLYRMGDFKNSAEQFAKTRKYNPDYLALYESYLYEAASLGRLGKYEVAEEILSDLFRDGKYEEWQGFTEAQQINLLRLKLNDPEYLAKIENSEEDEDEKEVITEQSIMAEERRVDSTYTNNTGLIAYYYERGMDKFDNDDYNSARNYFNKSRITRTDVYEHSRQMFDLTNTWQMKQSEVKTMRRELNDDNKSPSDSLKNAYAKNLFVLGRTHEKMGNADSANYYYKISAENSQLRYEESARYLYAYARFIQDSDPYTADSLLEVIINTHPLTDYGEEARNQLGFTDAFVIDSVAELYASGDKNRRFGNNYYAINQFLKIYTHYPATEYAPKAIYTIGWMYEDNNYDDLALYYYKLLLDEYPRTEYAEDIRLTVAYMDALAKDEPLPDSLRERKIRKQKVATDKKLKPDPNFDPAMQQGAEDPGNMDPRELLKNPGKLLKEKKNLLKNPKELLKNFKMPSKEEILEMPKLNIDAEKENVDKNPSDTTKKR